VAPVACAASVLGELGPFFPRRGLGSVVACSAEPRKDEILPAGDKEMARRTRNEAMPPDRTDLRFIKLSPLPIESLKCRAKAADPAPVRASVDDSTRLPVDLDDFHAATVARRNEFLTFISSP
jgi:hypothetical protein